MVEDVPGYVWSGDESNIHFEHREKLTEIMEERVKEGFRDHEEEEWLGEDMQDL